MARYPQAQAAAPVIRRAGEEALAIEEWIRENYRDSDRPEEKIKFLSITYYLQELLLDVSNQYEHQPDNYDLLIRDLFESQEHVVFISLNYDLLLDRRLNSLEAPGLNSMDGYARPGRRWSLIKVHGSVNWGRAKDPNFHASPTAPPADLLEHVESEIIYTGLDGDISDMRRGQVGTNLLALFPALAVPTGGEYELVCPSEHASFLGETLENAEGIDLLSIGYSGIDEQVATLITESGTPIRSLFVVDRNRENAVQVEQRLANALGLGFLPGVYEEGFESFVAGSALRRYLRIVTEGRKTDAARWPLSITVPVHARQ